MKTKIIALAFYQVAPHWLQCGDCGGWFDPCENVYMGRFAPFYVLARPSEVDGAHVCHNCLTLRGVSVCDICNNLFEGIALIEYNDKMFCYDCQVDADIEECESCNNYFQPGDLEDCDGCRTCEDCRDAQGYQCCSSCGYYYNNTICVYNDTYCESCFNEHYTYCGDCGENVRYDNAVRVDDHYYHEDCVPESDGWSGCDEYDKVGSSRQYGVELETHECQDYDEFNHSAWSSKYEPSVSGLEFITKILHGNDGFVAIYDLCGFAAKHNWKINNRCGYHLHIDMRGESADSLKAIALAYHTTYKVWKDCVENHRHTENYCCPSHNELSEYHSLSDKNDWTHFTRYKSRYDWVNWNAYNLHGSLEIRLHEGTVDGKTVCNWVRAHTTFADWANNVGYTEVRRALWGRTPSEQLEVLQGVWVDAGCADLVEFYKNKELVCT